MGFSADIAIALDPTESTHNHVVEVLRSEMASEWSKGAAVATMGSVTVVTVMEYVPPDGQLLSAELTDPLVPVLTVNIFDSDFAEIRVFESGKQVACAVFGLEGLNAAKEENAWLAAMVEDGEDAMHEAMDKQVPMQTEQIVGLEWWIATRPGTSPEELERLVNEPYVFAEQQVEKLLAPMGVTMDVLNAFAPDLIANAGGHQVTAV